MRIGLIVNTRSGKGIDNSVTEHIMDEFEQHGMSVILSECTETGSVDKAVGHLSSHHPGAIVVAGGDGTISSVVAKVAPTTTPLGILPLGTSNHFARDLGLPMDLDEAIAVIASCQPSRVDAASVNGRWFINNSSIGLYPLAVIQRKGIERALGWSKRFAMMRAMFRVFRKFPRFMVRLETEKGEYVRETAFVFIGNNEYDGGARASVDGKCLSVYTAHMKGRWGILVMGLLNMIGGLGDKYFDRHLVQRVELDTAKQRMIVSIDGEVLEMAPPLEYRIHPHALHIFLPPKKAS